MLGVAAPAIAAEEPSSVLLVIDTSGSMRGERITAARTAATSAVAQMPDSLKVGLAQFDTLPRVLVSPTTDHAEVQTAIEGLKASGSTALYDSVSDAVRQLEPGAVLIVLSDGADTASASQLHDSVFAANHAGIPVNVVGLGLSPQEQDVMRELTDATGGKLVSAANVDALIPVYERAVAELAPHVTPLAPTSLGERVQLAIAAATVAFVALAVLLFAISFAYRSGKAARQQRHVLDRYAIADDTQYASARERSVLVANLAGALDRAGIGFSPRQWLAMWAGLCVLIAVVVVLLSGSAPFAIVLAVAVATVTPIVIVRSREAKRITEFQLELPAFFREVASALRSGMSFAQALGSVAADGDGELNRQIRRALGEIQMGATIDAALTRVAERMQSTDMRWAVTALSIQREVGGNLAHILDTAAKTINERAQIDREVKTLSAEGRISAIILVSLPVGLFLFLFLTRREYLELFWTTAIGWSMLALAALLIAIGWIWLRRTMRIEV